MYWQKIFQASPDPTFVLLTFIWHVIYAWDGAFEDLYTHISQLVSPLHLEFAKDWKADLLHQETRVISTSTIAISQELHAIRIHQRHHSSLLEDVRKTVEFIRITRNPAMDSFSKETRLRSAELMESECSNLMNEIDRLDASRRMLEKQLEVVINLVNAWLNSS